MTRLNFLKALKKKLRWQIPPRDVRKIVGDYEAYFNNGVVQAKDEEQLVAECGDLDLIVEEILTDYQPIRNLKPRLIIVSLVWVTAFFMCGSLSNDFLRAALVFVLASAGVCIAEGKQLFCKHAVGLRGMALLYAFNLLLIGGVLGFVYTVTHRVDLLLNQLLNQLQPVRWGPAVYTMLMIIVVIIIALCIASSAMSAVASVFFVPLVFLNASVLCFVFSHMELLKNLSDPQYYSRAVELTNLNIYAGIVVAILSAAVIFAVRKVKKW